jgi:uncharacterized protein YlaI
MLELTCMTCRKKYIIDHRDPLYTKIKQKKTKYYICSKCNSGMQNEAARITGINPNDIDEHEKFAK